VTGFLAGSSAVFLKVGGIAPLGAILRGRRAKKTKGDGGQNNTNGAKMLTTNQSLS